MSPTHHRHRRRAQHAAQDAIRRWRKRAQLVTQVAQSVQMFLADEADDDLCLLTYSHAELIGSGEHIQVVMLAPPASQDEPVNLEELQARLDAITPEVRREVAHDIHRRRAPLLSFVVVPAF